MMEKEDGTQPQSQNLSQAPHTRRRQERTAACWTLGFGTEQFIKNTTTYFLNPPITCKHTYSTEPTQRRALGWNHGQKGGGEQEGLLGELQEERGTEELEAFGVWAPGEELGGGLGGSSGCCCCCSGLGGSSSGAGPGRGLGVRAGAAVPGLWVPGGGEGWRLALRGSGGTEELCSARGVFAAFLLLRWRFLRAREPQEFSVWESLLDSSILFTGQTEMGLGLEHGESSWQHCGAVLGTAGSGVVTGASAERAEREQNHLRVCSSGAPPNPGALLVPPAQCRSAIPCAVPGFWKVRGGPGRFRGVPSGFGRSRRIPECPGESRGVPRDSQGLCRTTAPCQDRAVARRMRRESSALLRAG